MSFHPFSVRSIACSLVCAAGFATTAVQAEVQLVVQEPWVRATVPQQPASGAFMSLVANQDSRLVEVRSPVAKQVEIHEMSMDNDIMRMRQIAGLDLPKGQQVDLRPGGYHVMLIGLHQPMTAGQVVPLTLVLEGPGGQRQTVAVEAEVRALGNAGHGAGHGAAAQPPAAAPAAHGAAATGHAGHGSPAAAGHGSAGGHGAAVSAAPTAAAASGHAAHGSAPASGQAGHGHSAAQASAATALPALPAGVATTSCWVRALPAPLPSAAYLQIHNGTADPVTLAGAEAPGFGHVMVHQTQTRDGVASMVHAPAIPVAAGAALALEPGSYHVMLEQPAAELAIGSSLGLALQFDGYAPRRVDCEVRSARG